MDRMIGDFVFAESDVSGVVFFTDTQFRFKIKSNVSLGLARSYCHAQEYLVTHFEWFIRYTAMKVAFCAC